LFPARGKFLQPGDFYGRDGLLARLRRKVSAPPIARRIAHGYAVAQIDGRRTLHHGRTRSGAVTVAPNGCGFGDSYPGPAGIAIHYRDALADFARVCPRLDISI